MSDSSKHLDQCVFVSRMPEIARTDFRSLAMLADHWLQRHKGTSAVKLSIQQRRADPGAAAAWALRTFENKSYLEACQLCGTWTASWCEGCYAADAKHVAWRYSALCTLCDEEKLVCRKCTHDGITWRDGHSAYKMNASSELDTEVEVVQLPDGSMYARRLAEETDQGV